MQFPFFRQLDAMDCGPTCLRMITKYYGRSCSMQQLRSLSYSTREGVSLLSLCEAAETLGFRSRGVRVTWEQLRDEVTLPCIIHWNQKHFVVVTGISRKSRFSFLSKRKEGDEVVQIADPAHGMLSYTKDEFLKCWIAQGNEGIALLLEPSTQFYKEEEDKKDHNIRKFGYLLNYLRPYRKFIIQLLLGMLTGSLVSMIFPFLTQSIVDYGIGNSDLNFIGMVLVAQLVLTVCTRWCMPTTRVRCACVCV